ncbi:MAG: DivIVA domain-containing protein [Actinomycetota bacterium]|nr:DivIVA domain-containing protein [Actinomycetota bacterium]
MGYSSTEIEEREFLTSAGGYDKDEVRAFLAAIAREHARLSERLRELEQNDPVNDLGPRVAEILETAETAARNVRAAADAEAKATRERAEQEASSLHAAAEQATAKLREEAEQYAFEIRNAAERAVREQHAAVADRIGRMLTGESQVRERLYSVEVTLQSLRADLQAGAEEVYPEMAAVQAVLNSPNTGSKASPEAPRVIDLREPPPVPPAPQPGNGSSRRLQ